LKRADEIRSQGRGATPSSMTLSLHLAAACFAKQLGSGDLVDWIAHARGVLVAGADAPLEVRCAAAEMLVAAGGQDDFAQVLDAAPEVSCEVSLHAAVAALRGMRQGGIAMTSQLVGQLASEICASFGPSRVAEDAEKLFAALRSFQKPHATRARLADRLRVSATLPSLYALAPTKKQREAAGRFLQVSLLKTLRQSEARQEQLLDYVVACFLHFLSRLAILLREAAATASSYPDSSKVAAFFVEALLRAEPQRSTPLLGNVLGVCDRVQYFVDRDLPASDAVQRASFVLRHVAERRCTEIGAQAVQLRQAARRGAMPAELFAVRSDVQAREATPLEAGASAESSSRVATSVGTTALPQPKIDVALRDIGPPSASQMALVARPTAPPRPAAGAGFQGAPPPSAAQVASVARPFASMRRAGAEAGPHDTKRARVASPV